MMGAQAYGPMMWVSPCERCEQMVQGQTIDKVHRHMSLYELFGQSVGPSHKKMWKKKNSRVCLFGKLGDRNNLVFHRGNAHNIRQG